MRFKLSADVLNQNEWGIQAMRDEAIKSEAEIAEIAKVFLELNN